MSLLWMLSILGFHKESRCLLLSQPALVGTATTSCITTPIVAQETIVECASPDATVVGADSVQAYTYVSPLPLEAKSIETIACTHSPTSVTGPTTTTVEATTITTALCNPTPINIEVVTSSSPMVTDLFTPPRSSSLQSEIVQENVLGSNQFAAFDVGVYGDEMGDGSFQRTRGGRTIKPTHKIQENQWITVGGRGKRGRGGRG